MTVIISQFVENTQAVANGEARQLDALFWQLVLVGPPDVMAEHRDVVPRV